MTSTSTEAQISTTPPPPHSKLERWAGVLLVVAATAIYLRTIDTGLLPEELRGGDLITHHYAQVQARPGNAPGYPIYTMLGWLWFHTASTVLRLTGNTLFNPIPVLSVYSSIWALVALWLLYRILCFITSGRYRKSEPASDQSPKAGNILLAVLLSAFYAVTYFFWYYATTSEQYSSAVAQTLAILYLYLLWSEAQETHQSARADRMLVALALLCGISLAHMLTVAFIVPPLVAVVLWQQPALLRRGKMILAAVAAAALPLAAYLFIYLRGAAHPEWWGQESYASAAEWFWAFVRTSQGFQELRWGTAEGRPFWGGAFPELIWQELSIPLLLVGIIGIALLRRRTAILIYATLVIYLIFCWAYRYGNWYQVIMPAYPLLLVGAAAAIDRVLTWQPLTRYRNWSGALVPVLLVAAILWRTAASLPAANSNNRPGDTALNRPAVLLATAPDDGALFAAVDDRLGLDYLRSIWRVPKAITLVDSNSADADSRVRPLLSTWEAARTLLDEIDPDDWRVSGSSPDWVEVGISGTTHFPLATPAEGETIWLTPEVGVQVIETRAAPTGAPVFAAPSAIDVTLRWVLPAGQMPENQAMSIRPASQGKLIALDDSQFSQVDIAQPLHGLLARALDPSDAQDAVRLPLPEDYADVVDGILFVLYRADSGEVIAETSAPVAFTP